MLFGEGRKFSSLFATHPPLTERIRRLDPTFDPGELERLSARWAGALPSGMDEDRALGFTSPAPRSVSAPVLAWPAAVVAAIGTPAAGSFDHAGALLRAIPEDVHARALRADTVVALVLGLVLSRDQPTRTGQCRLVEARLGRPVADAAWTEADALGRLDPALRLPLAQLAFPALRHRSSQELQAVQALLGELVRADGNVDVFEYCLSALVHRDLFETMFRKPPWTVRGSSLGQAAPAVATLLAVVAAVGHRAPATAAAAFQAGLARVLPTTMLPFQPPPRAWQALDGVWPALDGLDGRAKALVVDGLATVVWHDGVVEVAESELLRMVCAMLHCPLPPLAAVGRGALADPLPPRG